MPAVSLLKYCYLAYFSQPKGERLLYRALRRAKVSSIVELGVGKAERARRLMQVAQRFRPDTVLRYTGIDLFEGRLAGTGGLTLKRAHQTLSDSGAKVQLVPGDPFSALVRTANTLTNTDLLIISADQDAAALAKAWFYVPRMLHPRSLVYVESAGAAGKTEFRLLPLTEIDALAAANGRSKRAA